MPWVDTALIILVLSGAYLGYCKGFISCLKGIAGCLAGLVAAWLTKPLAMAWLQTRWDLETRLARFLGSCIPENVEELLEDVSQVAGSLQELKESLLSLPLPPEIISYLSQTLQSSGQEIFNAASSVEALLLAAARSIIGALVFLTIWWLVSFAVRRILGLLAGGAACSLLGVADGLLGLVTFTALELGGLILLAGALYPAALLQAMGGGESAGFYKLIAGSGILRFLAEVYQLYVVPLLA